MCKYVIYCVYTQQAYIHVCMAGTEFQSPGKSGQANQELPAAKKAAIRQAGFVLRDGCSNTLDYQEPTNMMVLVVNGSITNDYGCYCS